LGQKPGRVVSGQDGHIGANGVAVGVVAAIAVGAVTAFSAHWAVWTGLALWLLLWLIAVLALTDAASRKFLSGTLRKSTYTQIYTTLTRRNVTWLWGKVCDEAEDEDSLTTFLRAALTWKLYDAALLIAMAYPLILMSLQWVGMGAEGRLGSIVVFPAAAFWPERALVISLLGFISFGLVRSYLGLGRRNAKRKGGFAPPILWGIGGLLVLVARDISLAAAVAIAIVFLVGNTVGISISFNARNACLGAFSLLVALFGLLALRVLGDIGNEGWFAFSIVVLFALFVFLALFRTVGAIFRLLEDRGRQVWTMRAATGLTIASVVLLAYLSNWSGLVEGNRNFFLFLGVFPLINALFDTVSYAATLSLIRRGLRSRVPWLWGLLDLVFACGLFLVLGATLVAVIHGLNLLAGVPLLDFGALFAGVYETPGQYVWLYLMLFSTILPTALHGLLSLLGVQGIWPRGPRRRVADWIDRVEESPMHAVRAGLALSLIWTVPLLIFGGIAWGLWQFGGGAVETFLGWYFQQLLWIAQVPVGAF